MITIKNDREIEMMRHAGHIVGLVHKTMSEVLQPGMDY